MSFFSSSSCIGVARTVIGVALVINSGSLSLLLIAALVFSWPSVDNGNWIAEGFFITMSGDYGTLTATGAAEADAGSKEGALADTYWFLMAFCC
jgi:hypothetical protein